MSFFWWLVTGLLAGGLARRAVGAEKRGCLATIVIGVIGAMIAGAVYRFATGDKLDAFNEFDLGSVFAAFVGACALLFVLQAIERR
jgi:uncharacterized membrane protein YeaQ/YmgE (transglycosylase-associated protein family)